MSNAMRDSIVARVTEIAERVGASEGIEIVEVLFSGGGAGRSLRIVIDKPGGVSHEDCETISQQVGTILDVEDVIPGGAYHLEVSSPGVERKLVRPRDYERFTGQKVKVVLREPVEGQRRWEGVLTSFADGVVTLETPPARDGVRRSVRFPLTAVEKANLKFEW